MWSLRLMLPTRTKEIMEKFWSLSNAAIIYLTFRKMELIRLTRDIQRNHFGLHPMLIRLQDMGQPSLFTTTRVSEQLLV